MNKGGIELWAWELSSSVLVLLFRAIARRGFVRRQCGRFFRERRCGPSTTYGHRIEHHCHRKSLPSQHRGGRACAKQACSSRWSGVPTAALRQLLLAYGCCRYVVILIIIIFAIFVYSKPSLIRNNSGRSPGLSYNRFNLAKDSSKRQKERSK
jgi:hypothetical protein